MSDEEETEEEDIDIACERCGKTDDGGDDESRQMLLCDTCDAGWHLYCLPVGPHIALTVLTAIIIYHVLGAVISPPRGV